MAIQAGGLEERDGQGPSLSTVPPFPGSLTKDMTGKEDNYRGPAVRALCQITDVSSSTLCLLPGLLSETLPQACSQLSAAL